MSSFDYVGKLARVGRLIDKYGQQGTIQKISAGTGVLLSSYACTFVQLDYTNEERDGALIRANDRRIIIKADAAAAADPPTPEDRHVMGVTVAQIVTARPLAPDGRPLYFELQLRS